MFAADGLDEALRLEAGFEMDFCAEEWRNPQAHELAEDVAERERVEKMKWVEDALVLQVLLDLGLDGVEAREHVAMGVDDTFRLRGCAGGEEDLKRRVEGQVGLRR